MGDHLSTLSNQWDASNIAEGKGKRIPKTKSIFKIARGSVLASAAIHDALRVCEGIDDESNRHDELELKRIVSMMTRRLQRIQSVAEDALEHEHDCRRAEYEEQREIRNSQGHVLNGAAVPDQFANQLSPATPLTRT